MVREDGGVFLVGCILPQLGQVGVDGGFLGHTFDLQFDRRDLEHTGKGLDDVALFPRRPQHKVNGFDFENFDVPAVGGGDDAVLDFGNRQQVVKGLATGQFAGGGAALAHHLGAFGQLGFVLVVDDAVTLPIDEPQMSPLVGFEVALHGRGDDAPALQKVEPVGQKLGQAVALDADNGKNCQRQRDDNDQDQPPVEG